MKNFYLIYSGKIKFVLYTIVFSVIFNSQYLFGQSCDSCNDATSCPTINITSGGVYTVTYCYPKSTPCQFTVPSHVSAITVEAWGGGGGGGAYSKSQQSGYEACAAGGGGGGGAYSMQVISVIPGQQYEIIVGKGGVGGLGGSSSSSDNNGQNGESSFIRLTTSPAVKLVEAKGGASGGGAVSIPSSWHGADYRVNGVGGLGGAANVGVGITSYPGGNGLFGMTGSSYDKGGLGGGGAGSSGAGKTPTSNNDPSENGGAATNNCGGIGGGRTCRAHGNGSVGCDGSNGEANGGGGCGGVAHCSYNKTKSSKGGNGAHGMVRITFTSALSVTLSSFSTICKQEGPILKWTTVSERNASHFLLERSRDGENWEFVDEIQASGTTNHESSYSIQDVLFTNSSIYYRLKEVDFSGNIHIYDPIVSECLSEQGVKVFPNPTNGSFLVEISSDIKFEGVTKIYDLNGRLLVQQNVYVENGKTQLLFDKQLSSGTYIIHIENESEKRFLPIKVVVK